ncbi:MAG: SRPBCC family protein [Candidatus Obscuribacterales bacterium]|nr:SRPBCC family protein [Candidatus Obscuribacterales bacterium]
MLPNYFYNKVMSVALGLVFSVVILPSVAPVVAAEQTELAKEHQEQQTLFTRLQKGEIVVGMKDVGKTKFVTGHILIDQPLAKVWPIMVNPFEFKGKIAPRVKKIDVVTDQTNLSVLRMTLDTTPIPLMPTMSYTVESKYDHSDKGGKIEFRRISGSLKDFKGTWEVCPADGGTKTALTYSMYVDPGFFIPQWVVRESVKVELPRTLQALRTRVMAVCDDNERPEVHTILAANINAHPHL